MKVIFLDIDGVLNKHENAYFINERYVKRLSKIVHKTNSRIVISSNWRHLYKIENLDNKQRNALNTLNALFSKYELEIFDITPIIGYGPDSRPNEIKNWLMKHEVKSYVILDDETMWNWNELESNLVLTNGLSIFHVYRAIQILERK